MRIIHAYREQNDPKGTVRRYECYRAWYDYFRVSLRLDFPGNFTPLRKNDIE